MPSKFLWGHKNVLLSLKINFVLTNSKDHDEMLLYVAFHLGLHCLPNYMVLGDAGKAILKIN